MSNTIINEIADWNIVRDNLRYTSVLEYSMLDEELNEYLEAALAKDLVGQADALADLIVVAVGGLTKMCNGDVSKVEDILLAVTAANNTKSDTKNSEGKITKPDNFCSPESMIKRILDED